MRVEDEIHYPVSPAEVAAMLADPEFVERKMVATHALSHDVEVVGTADGAFTVTTRRTMPTSDLPDLARSFVGETIDVRQVEAWEAAAPDGSRAGTVVVEVLGAPLRLTGTLRLAPDGGGTTETLAGDLKASVPLVGSKLEKAAEPAFMAAVRKEHEVGKEWLGG
ncbi:MAG: DUF2505 domain-containing protein [Actinomycetota bacterium]